MFIKWKNAWKGFSTNQVEISPGVQKHHGHVGVMAHDGEVKRGVAANSRVVGNVNLGPGVKKEADAIQMSSGAGNVEWSFAILENKKIMSDF